MKILTLIFSSLFFTLIGAYDVAVRTPDGEVNVINVIEEQKLADFFESLKMGFGEESYCVVDIVGEGYLASTIRSKKASAPRNYNAAPSSSNVKDIAYIVNTLGMASLVKIAKESSSIKKAGDRLDQLHPFHFIATIFSNDQMKASIHALKDRGWIWSDFFGGINKSMTEEQAYNNILPHAPDFAARVGIDPNLIIPSLERGNWKEFVNILLESIPRNQNNNRYRY